MTIDEITRVFRDGRVLEGNTNTVTPEGRRAILTLETALKNGFAITGKSDPMMGVDFSIWRLSSAHPNRSREYNMCEVPINLDDYVCAKSGRVPLGKKKEMIQTIINMQTSEGSGVHVSDIIRLVDNRIESYWYINRESFEQIEL